MSGSAGKSRKGAQGVRPENGTYYVPELLDVLRQNLQMSPETWHKVMNPMCGTCMAERGRSIIRKPAGCTGA